jgi:hypothetical protein
MNSYKLDDQKLIPGRGRIFLFTTMSSQLRGPPCLLSLEYWRLLPNTFI